MHAIENARLASPMISPREVQGVPENPDVSLDTPSVKVTGVPPGTGSDQLHQALLAAGCTGNITDVYIPKGDRGFGFVRFARQEDAERLLQLPVGIFGVPLSLEMAVSARKGKRDIMPTASTVQPDVGMYGHGPATFGGFGPASSFGHGPGMTKGGFGPSMPRKG